jgi:hypothetical protein
MYRPIVAKQQQNKNPCIVAKQRLGKNFTATTKTYATVVELMDASLSMRSVSYQGM